VLAERLIVYPQQCAYLILRQTKASGLLCLFACDISRRVCW